MQFTGRLPLFKNHLRLVDLTTRGNPMSPLLWTYKSTQNVAEALTSLRHYISHQTVAQFLAKLGNITLAPNEAHTNPTRQRGECLSALAGASG